MAWIESHESLGQHPKTEALADLLGVSMPAVVGHLHYLWWWAINYAPDGDLSGYSAKQIARAAKWDGDADAFERLENAYIDWFSHARTAATAERKAGAGQ